MGMVGIYSYRNGWVYWYCITITILLLSGIVTLIVLTLPGSMVKYLTDSLCILPLLPSMLDYSALN